MAHVIILREAPSFVQAKDAVQGTHEFVETNIASRKYLIDGARKGYTIATGSEFKLIWYRIKKDAVHDFVRDIGNINLNPKTLPKGFFLSLFLPVWLVKKYNLLPPHWMVGVGRFNLWLMLFFKLVPFLKGVDIDRTGTKPFNTSKDVNLWCYNYFLGYIEDKDDIL